MIMPVLPVQTLEWRHARTMIGSPLSAYPVLAKTSNGCSVDGRTDKKSSDTLHFRATMCDTARESERRGGNIDRYMDRQRDMHD